jgi:hypothetical protein
LVTLGIGFGVAVLALFAFLIYVLLASGEPKYWEGEIAAFERRDVSNPPPENAVLFVGGRDVRLWERLAEDMAPIPVIQRGFGGAQIKHIDYYRARIIHPYKPRAVVVMAGDGRKTCSTISERLSFRCARKISMRRSISCRSVLRPPARNAGTARIAPIS